MPQLHCNLACSHTCVSDIRNSIAIAVVSSFGEYYVFVRVNAPGVWVADATPPTMLL